MKKIIVLFLLILGLSACKRNKEKTTEPIKGTISGKVQLYNCDGSLSAGSAANVTVAIESQGIFAATDQDGAYTLNNVAAGILDITFTAPDGTVKKMQQVSFVGNGNLVKNERIFFTSTNVLTVRCYDSTSTGEKGIWVRSVIQQPAAKGSTYALLCFANSNNFAPQLPAAVSYSVFIYFSNQKIPGRLTSDVFLPYAHLKDFGAFASGQKIFVNIFSSPNAAYSNYYDPYIDKTVNYAAAPASSGPFVFTQP